MCPVPPVRHEGEGSPHEGRILLLVPYLRALLDGGPCGGAQTRRRAPSLRSCNLAPQYVSFLTNRHEACYTVGHLTPHDTTSMG
jgi:hypothetical protein